MSATGFGSLSPDSDQQMTGDSSMPAGARRPRAMGERLPLLWIAAIAAVTAIVLVVTALVTGRTDHDNANGGQPDRFSVRAAHGPTRVIDNVPVGYSHDQEGAATAAVNVVQALAQAGQGRIQMSTVVSALVATNPGPELRKSVDISDGRSNNDDVLTVLPAAVTVTSLTDTVAEVSVWTMGVSRASIGPGDPVSVTTLWSTSAVSLVWQDGDWKAQEKSGRVGPTPDEVVAPNSGSPLTKPLLGGYYTFYVN
ncbi:hypothetical protein ACIBG0_36845 [Nocardia sp. NPDC050630]|uniref:hypothetical protein n=1 Tax=Nocardia sp. NPDC050630 TaxID=3364321 RepID=UPI0037B4FCD1